MKKLGKAILILCGSAALLIVSLQIIVNTPFFFRKANEIAARFIDGKISYSGMNISFIRSFPNVVVTLDSLTLTYPHDRFARYDGSRVRNQLLNRGRGEEVDTLIHFDRFSAVVNVMRLIDGTIRVKEANLHGAALYAHKYDTTANWMIFKNVGEKNDSSKNSIPRISVRNFSISKNTRLVYTDDLRCVYSSIDMKDLFVEGDLKIKNDPMEIAHRNVLLLVDSLWFHVALPPDQYDLSLDRLSVSNPGSGILNVNVEADALANWKGYGEYEIPLFLDASIEYVIEPASMGISVPKFKANVAYVPLEADGHVALYDGGVKMRVNAAIRNCEIGEFYNAYWKVFSDLLHDLPVQGLLNLDMTADGCYSKKSKPVVDAKVNLDASAPGTSVCFDGESKNLLGSNPFFDVHAHCRAVLDSLMRFVPDSLGLKAEGDVDVNVNGKVCKSELDSFKFRTGEVCGRLLSDRIRFEMPSDSLRAIAHSSSVNLKSDLYGLNFSADFDSLFFNIGAGVRASFRKMKNSFKLKNVEVRGEKTPRLEFDTSNSRFFVKVAENRIGLTDVKINSAIQRRVRRRAHADSLSRRARLARTRESGSSGEFSGTEVSIQLDSSVTKFFRVWEPYGSVRANKGFFSSPSIPLRTRISAICCDFNSNEITVDSLKVRMGTSDVAAKGHVKGIRRAIKKRGILNADFDLESERLNLNELLLAFQKGEKTADKNPDSDSEGSFVVDSIAGADVSKQKIDLIVIPGNVDFSLGVVAHSVNIADFRINPFVADLKMKDRTLQLTNAKALTDFGGAQLDAFYSTRSKSDVAAGLGLKLRDVSAYGIIHLLPQVDDLIPALKSFEGNLGLDLSVTTKIDSNMNVAVPSLDGILRITGQDLNVSDAGDLRKITRLLGFRDKNIGHIQNLYVDAAVHDSRLEVFPFELSVDRYKLALRGKQAFDGKLEYHVSVMKSPFLIPFGINIFGYTDNWRFSIGAAKYREGKVPVYTRQLDTMQVNIIRSIRNVYDKGVKNVRILTERGVEISSAEAVLLESLNSEDLDHFERLSFDMVAAAAEEELSAEVEIALSENVINLDKLFREYEAQTEDRKIERRIKKLKNKKK